MYSYMSGYGNIIHDERPLRLDVNVLSLCPRPHPTWCNNSDFQQCCWRSALASWPCPFASFPPWSSSSIVLQWIVHLLVAPFHDMVLWPTGTILRWPVHFNKHLAAKVNNNTVINNIGCNMCNLGEKLLNTIFCSFSQAVSIQGAKILKSYWISTEMKWFFQEELKMIPCIYNKKIQFWNNLNHWIKIAFVSPK